MYTTLDVPGASSTQAYGINNSGHIVGCYYGDDNNRGFVYDGATYTTLDAREASPNAKTYAYGISNSGNVVGYYWVHEGGNAQIHGFVYDGAYTTLDVEGVLYSQNYGINDSGVVVGYYIGPFGFKWGPPPYVAGTYSELDIRWPWDINDSGMIVGGGVVYDGHTYTPLNVELPGVTVMDTRVYGISDSGVIVGSYMDEWDPAGGGNHGFIAAYEGDDTTPPTTPTLAAGVAGPDHVVLSWTTSSDDSGHVHYEVYRDGMIFAPVTDGATSYSDRDVEPGQVYTYTVVAADPSGNVSAPSNEVAVSIPSAAAETPSLGGFLAGMENGDHADTSQSQPTFRGEGSPGQTVVVAFGLPIGSFSTVVDNHGEWVVDLSNAGQFPQNVQLPDGDYPVDIFAISHTGELSDVVRIDLTVDTSVVPPMLGGVLTGVSPGGHAYVMGAQPEFRGFAPPGHAVTVDFEVPGGSVSFSATTGPDGEWVLDLSDPAVNPNDTHLADQTYPVRFSASSPDGRISEPLELDLTVTGVLPPVLEGTLLGIGRGDHAYVVGSQPGFEGRAAPNHTVSMEFEGPGGTVVFQALAGADGRWALDLADPLANPDDLHLLDETYEVRLRATSPTGGQSAIIPFDLTVTSVLPPFLEGMLAGMQTGDRAHTAKSQPRFEGRAAPNHTVTLEFEGPSGSSVFRALVGEDGRWALDLADPAANPAGIYLVEHTYAVDIHATSPGGRDSEAISIDLTVDGVAPPMLGGVLTGVSPGGHAYVMGAQPEFRGFAPPGHAVTVDFEVPGGSVSFSATTGPDGEWVLDLSDPAVNPNNTHLADQTYPVRFSASSPDGRISEPLELDLTVTGVLPPLLEGTLTGVGHGDHAYVLGSQPGFEGRAAPNHTVSMEFAGPGGAVVFQALAGADGRWALDLTDPIGNPDDLHLLDETYEVRLRATSPTGGQSAIIPFDLTVASVLAPFLEGMLAGMQTGDHTYTAKSQPRFEGRAAPNHTVTLEFEGPSGSSVFRALAGEDGRWALDLADPAANPAGIYLVEHTYAIDIHASSPGGRDSEVISIDLSVQPAPVLGSPYVWIDGQDVLGNPVVPSSSEYGCCLQFDVPIRSLTLKLDGEEVVAEAVSEDSTRWTFNLPGLAPGTHAIVVEAEGDDGSLFEYESSLVEIDVREPPHITATMTQELSRDANRNGRVNPGDRVRHTVVVTNSGGMPARAVEFFIGGDPHTSSHPLGGDTILVAGSVRANRGAIHAGNGSTDGEVSVRIPRLDPGESATIEFEVDVTPEHAIGDEGLEVAHHGVVYGENFGGLPGVSTNPSAFTVFPAKGPDVRVSLEAAPGSDDHEDGLVNPGESIRFTATIRNYGDAATAIPQSFFYRTNVLDTELANGSVRLFGPDGNPMGGVLKGNGVGEEEVEVTIPPLAPGDTYTVEFEVTVLGSFGPDSDDYRVSTQGQLGGDEWGDGYGLLSSDPSLPGNEDETVLTVFPSHPAGLLPDFGDAPDSLGIPGYPTLLVHDGAYHLPMEEPSYLGQCLDGEVDGIPEDRATGDDLDNGIESPTSDDDPDDEDGVIFLTMLKPGQIALVEVLAHGSPLVTMHVDAWIDFDGDREWDGHEKIFVSRPLLVGTNALAFNVPPEAVVGTTYARFRVSQTGSLTPFGGAAGGEVEDYAVEIMPGGPILDVRRMSVEEGRMNLEWSTSSLKLQRSADIRGPWEDVPEAISPLEVWLRGSSGYFRLVER